MLEENYRSHPAIIKIPSELFYNSRLFASTAFQQKDKLSHWDKLPKKVSVRPLRVVSCVSEVVNLFVLFETISLDTLLYPFYRDFLSFGIMLKQKR